MIQSVQDVAELFTKAVWRETGGEARAGSVRERAYVTPPEVVFDVETVEGKRFRITIQHEPNEVRT